MNEYTKAQTKENLSDPNIWTRLLYMVLLGIAYAVAEAVFVLVAVFQFLAALFTRDVNRPLHEFSANLACYIYQIVRFQTFNSEMKPFPFSDWPDVEPGSTPWSGESDENNRNGEDEFEKDEFKEEQDVAAAETESEIDTSDEDAEVQDPGLDADEDLSDDDPEPRLGL